MPNVTNEQLLGAAKAGDLSVLKEWKKQNKTQNEGVDVNKVTDGAGSTPLHEACIEGHLECVKYLIESCEANINCQNNFGNTPLHHACSNGKLECVKYLIESCEGNINCQSNYGNALLHDACYNGHLETEQPKWQLQQHLKISIGEDQHRSFQTENRPDTIFLCGQGDDQQSIKANSEVLMINVPSVETLIDKGIQHQHANDDTEDDAAPMQVTIPLLNFQPKHVRYVLQCIYTGEISFNNNTHDYAGDDASHQPTPTLTGQDDLHQLILVANEFGFWRLKLVLEVELARKHLTEDTMIDVLIFANQHNCVVLKDTAMRMAAESEKDIFTHPDFGKLIPQPQLMREIHVFCSGRAESDSTDDEYK